MRPTTITQPAIARNGGVPSPPSELPNAVNAMAAQLIGSGMRVVKEHATVNIVKRFPKAHELEHWKQRLLSALKTASDRDGNEVVLWGMKASENSDI